MTAVAQLVKEDLHISTYLYHRISKCKAFSFVWDSSKVSPQRALPSEAGRKRVTHK